MSDHEESKEEFQHIQQCNLHVVAWAVD